MGVRFESREKLFSALNLNVLFTVAVGLTMLTIELMLNIYCRWSYLLEVDLLSIFENIRFYWDKITFNLMYGLTNLVSPHEKRFTCKLRNLARNSVSDKKCRIMCY